MLELQPKLFVLALQLVAVLLRLVLDESEAVAQGVLGEVLAGENLTALLAYYRV